MLETIIIVIAVISIVIIGGIFGLKFPAPYRSRPCQGRAWKKHFPTTSKSDIRKFLSFFTDAFALSDKEKLKLHPNDQLMDIYSALYPNPNWQPDVLEFETLSKSLKEDYCIDLNAIWHDNLTLGELFKLIQTNEINQYT